MTFAAAGQDTWDRTYGSIKGVIVDEYSRHAELKASDRVTRNDAGAYERIVSGAAGDDDYVKSLQTLIRMLRAHHGVAPIVLIDEYDAPIQKGYSKKYYDKAVGFMRDFFMNGLKLSSDFTFAYLTGVTKVSEEGIFSGLNNLNVYTVLDKAFSEYFGFTREEVQGILDHYGYGEKTDEVLEWYDGYDFGGKEMFNPWSVMSYMKNECEPKAYRADASQNLTVRDILSDASYGTTERLMRLLQGETVSCWVDEDVALGRLKNAVDAVFTLLLFSGYLKSLGKDPADRGGTDYLLKIPNKEIGRVFADEIAKRFRRRGRKDILKAVWDDIEKKDRTALEDDLCTYIGTSSTYYGTGEDFHHGLFLGLGAYKYPTHRISLEGESGDGRYDFGMEPLWNDPSLPAVIIEVKTVYRRNKDGKKVVVTPEELEKHAADARFQIDDKKYDTELRDRGFTDIIKLGIAFSGKNAKAVFDL